MLGWGRGGGGVRLGEVYVLGQKNACSSVIALIRTISKNNTLQVRNMKIRVEGTVFGKSGMKRGEVSRQRGH